MPVLRYSLSAVTNYLFAAIRTTPARKITLQHFKDS